MQGADSEQASMWHSIDVGAATVQSGALATANPSMDESTEEAATITNSFFEHNTSASAQQQNNNTGHMAHGQANITIRLTDNGASTSPDNNGAASNDVTTTPTTNSNTTTNTNANTTTTTTTTTTRQATGKLPAARSRGNPPKNPSSVTEIRAMLDSGQCYTKFREVNPDRAASARQSDVWKLFEEIISKDTNEFTGMIRCHNCLFITRYHGQTTGTSHMRRHRCFGELFPNSVKDAAKRHELRVQMAVANSSMDDDSIKLENDDSTGGEERSFNQSFTPNKRMKQEHLTIDDYGTIPDRALETFYEVRDIVTSQFVSYCMCKSCFHFVPYNLVAIEKHECKRPSKNDLLAAIGTQPKNGDLIFRHKPNIRSASDIWLNFQEIVDPTTNIILGWVRCTLCSAIVRASDRKAMPKTLRTHQVCCPKFDGNKSLLLKGNQYNPNADASTSSIEGTNAMKAEPKSRYYTPKTGHFNDGNETKFGYSGERIFNNIKVMSKNNSLLRPASKTDYKSAVINFCFSELVNLESICSDAFRNMALQLLKTAALQTKISAPIVLNLQSLQQQTDAKYEEEKNAIQKEINYCIEHNLGGTIVSDFKEDLCIMSLCYIDRNWKLQDRVLRGSSRISDFLQFISTTLKDYGLLEDTLINKFSYISNAGQLSGVKVHLSSASHLLDTCVDVAIFSDGRYDQLIQNCKHICCELKLLPDNSSADWMYKFDLIKTVMDNVDKFIPGNFSMDSMMQTMTTIKDLLTPFKEASQLMRSSVEQTPSINQVALQYFKLKKFLTETSNDPDMMEHKLSLLTELDNVIKLHMWHKLAVFFWPNFRHLKMFCEKERQEIQAEVRRLMEIHARHVEQSEEYKATITASSQYAEWEALSEFEQDELNRYLSDKSNSCNEKMLLTWWQEASKRYPTLAHIARSVLCMPASVTSIERRKKLHHRPPVDEKLIFLHCNIAAR